MTDKTIPFSVLDLAPIPEGSSAKEAFTHSLDLARLAEKRGYHRYWLAEHHNMVGIASAATSVLIGYLAANTTTLHLGSGGVMLPNHSPLVIAEQFGTLNTLYPGRIDLGLGRAPGSDQPTMRALRRHMSGDIDNFPRDVAELVDWFDARDPNPHVRPVPGYGEQIPVWLLGSSLYSAQLAAMYLLAVQMAKVKGRIDEKRHGELLEELCRIPDKIQKALDDKERIQWFASKYANAKDVFFIGRGIDYAISLEGSLKMKEISYIHSEAYAAGELKHGTISLIEDGILVVGVLTQNDLFEKTLSNMVEVKSRGAYLMGLTTYGNYSVEDTADFSVYVPKTEEYFSASLAIVPLQLMGYYVSVAKGLDVDKPRNLAKSVTVE